MEPRDRGERRWWRRIILTVVEADHLQQAAVV
jgi:hypothetical protein